ncbi:MAG: ACT domain-containing protein [Pseudomonadota bacterium]
MTGECDLSTLLRSIQPELHVPVYVFVTLADAAALQGLQPIMTFQESEGLTAIVHQADAGVHGWDGAFPSRMITLNVHSSLDAVGFLAAITGRLAALGIGVNPVSAFYHDHLFVPADRTEEALAALQELAEG